MDPVPFSLLSMVHFSGELVSAMQKNMRGELKNSVRVDLPINYSIQPPTKFLKWQHKTGHIGSTYYYNRESTQNLAGDTHKHANLDATFNSFDPT
jgi:hypothetical protein